MPCGMFGKLIAKRDFISVNTPRDLLLAWEKWLQASLASSKNELQSAWLKSYLHAPLWRFWLGEELCGMPVRGVFMSSMDGVGRHFPLAVFTVAPAGMVFEPPSDLADQSWYEAAEHFLLATIDAGEDYDAVLAQFATLAEGASFPLEERNCVSLHGALLALGPAGGLPVMAKPESTAVVGLAQEPEALSPANSVADNPDRVADTTVTRGDVAVAAECDAPVGETMAADNGETLPVAMSVLSLEPAPADSPVEDAAISPEPAAALTAQSPVPGFGFAELAAVHLQSSLKRRSFWWTIGGHDLQAMALAADGMPDPQLMSVMLGGVAPPLAG